MFHVASEPLLSVNVGRVMQSAESIVRTTEESWTMCGEVEKSAARHFLICLTIRGEFKHRGTVKVKKIHGRRFYRSFNG